jgi:hypothetical protein
VTRLVRENEDDVLSVDLLCLTEIERIRLILKTQMQKAFVGLADVCTELANMQDD